MINFLHTFEPQRIFISLGWLQIYYYGLFIVLGILLGIFMINKIISYYPKNLQIEKEIIIDLCFWTILSGILGARLYHVFLEFNYYIQNPINIFKIWNGGIAIHGAILSGGITLFYLARKYKINLLFLGAVSSVGLSIGQAIGRFGNYFNQELFGLPTDRPWGIPISIENRPDIFKEFEFFHPTFLYESLGSFLIFLILILGHYLIIKKKQIHDFSFLIIINIYFIFYSLLRFFLEFIRIDHTLIFAGLRWPQIISLLIIFFSILVSFLLIKYKNYVKK